jgi:hypothetical protein
MPPEGFEPSISAGERLLIYSLDRAATGTDEDNSYIIIIIIIITISYMQGIYTYIPETNPVPKEYNVAAIL